MEVVPSPFLRNRLEKGRIARDFQFHQSKHGQEHDHTTPSTNPFKRQLTSKEVKDALSSKKVINANRKPSRPSRPSVPLPRKSLTSSTPPPIVSMPNAIRRDKLAKKRILLGSRGKATTNSSKILYDEIHSKSSEETPYIMSKSSGEGTSLLTKSSDESSIGTESKDLDPNEEMRTKPRIMERLKTVKHVRKTLRSMNLAPLSIEREMYERGQPPSPNAATRANLDKRTARLRFSDKFSASIAEYRQGNPSLPVRHTERDNVLTRTNRSKHKGISVVVRKRPIFDYEIDRGEFDVVFPEAPKKGNHDVVVVHKCEMHSNMRHHLMSQASYNLTQAFDESCTNHEFYRHTAKPLVQLAKNGGHATILMYGQTGSGKTYTMSAIEARAADDLFETSFGEEKRIQVQFIEISSECKDLLDHGEVKVVEGPNGSVRLVHAATVDVSSAEELLRVIARGKRRRATEATDKNGTSSRSHAVCRITIERSKGKRGVLTLIDCAGSERRNDTLYHTKERQMETQFINSSLYALKQCIRAKCSGSGGFANYRASNLTRILRESLERDDANLCVVATVAPNATDTEHTMETLKTVTGLIDGQENECTSTSKKVLTPTSIGNTRRASKSPTARDPPTPASTASDSTATSLVSNYEQLPLLPPRLWDNKHLLAFLVKKRLVKANAPIPEHLTGRMVMRMSTIQLKNTFYTSKGDAKASKLFQMLRSETRRIDRSQRKERLVSTGNNNHAAATARRSGR